MTVPGEFRAEKPGGFQAKGRFEEDPLAQAFHFAVEHLPVEIPAAVTNAVDDHGGNETGLVAEQRVGPDDQGVLLVGPLAHVVNQTAKNLAEAQFAISRTMKIHSTDASDIKETL